jgi:acetyl-CoA synthetase
VDEYRVVWRADPDLAASTNTARFMAGQGIEDYNDLVRRSVADPEWFWSEVVDFLGLPFLREARAVRDTSRGHAWATWFVGGQFNLSQACVDRWADEDPSRIAIRSQKENGDTREIAFGELRDQTARFAGALVRLGVERGDPVAVYLPMNQEAVVAFLAVARIGAIFVPVFSGYGADAVAAPAPRSAAGGPDLRRRVHETGRDRGDEGGCRPCRGDGGWGGEHHRRRLCRAV